MMLLDGALPGHSEASKHEPLLRRAHTHTHAHAHTVVLSRTLQRCVPLLATRAQPWPERARAMRQLFSRRECASLHGRMPRAQEQQQQPHVGLCGVWTVVF
jgi:hypothetical protein